MMPRTKEWTVYVVPPRRKKRERSLYLRAIRRTNGGRDEEQRMSAGTNDPAIAERLRTTWECDLNSGRVAGDPDNPTFLSLIDLRLTNLRGSVDTSPNTIKGYEAIRKAFAGTSIANVSALDLAKRHLVQAQDELRQKGLAAATVKQYMAQAAAAWRWAVDLEYLKKEWPRLDRRRKVSAPPTSKRPYTDLEVEKIINWVRSFRGGQWLAVFQVLADTGARIGAVLGLHGKDVLRGEEPHVTFRVQWVCPGPKGRWRPLKTKDQQTVPIPRSTEALLPIVEPNALVFPNERDKRRPARPETIRDVLYRALDAIGVTDSENLDTHSLRRAWVRTAKREGIPNAVGMLVTGHKEETVYNGYGRNATGDDLRAAVEKVHAARKRAWEDHLKGASHAASHGIAAEPLDPKGLASLYDLTSEVPEGAARTLEGAASEKAAREATRHDEHVDARTRITPGGRHDRIVARVSGWAAEDHGAMLRLLDDAELRAHLRSALAKQGFGHADETAERRIDSA